MAEESTREGASPASPGKSSSAKDSRDFSSRERREQFRDALRERMPESAPVLTVNFGAPVPLPLSKPVGPWATDWKPIKAALDHLERADPLRLWTEERPRHLRPPGYVAAVLAPAFEQRATVRAEFAARMASTLRAGDASAIQTMLNDEVGLPLVEIGAGVFHDYAEGTAARDITAWDAQHGIWGDAEERWGRYSAALPDRAAAQADAARTALALGLTDGTLSRPLELLPRWHPEVGELGHEPPNLRHGGAARGRDEVLLRAVRQAVIRDLFVFHTVPKDWNEPLFAGTVPNPKNGARLGRTILHLLGVWPWAHWQPPTGAKDAHFVLPPRWWTQEVYRAPLEAFGLADILE